MKPEVRQLARLALDANNAYSRPRVYLSGPMTGKEALNFPAFYEAAAHVRALGYDVVNPAELNPNHDASWHACLRANLKELLDCTGLVLLDGWQQSAGAHLEMHVAHRVGLNIHLLRDLDPYQP